MTEKETKPYHIWFPELLSILLATTLAVIGWGATEYISSYKKFLKNEIRIDDLSEKLKKKELKVQQTESKLQQNQEKYNSLKKESQSANESLNSKTDMLNKLLIKEKKLSEIIQENSEHKKLIIKLKRELSKLKSNNSNIKAELQSNKTKNKELKNLVSKQNITLQTCNNRPTNLVNMENLYTTFAHGFEILKPSQSISIADGKSWINIVSIGKDINGIFAKAHSPIFENPKEIFCIRPKDAFKIYYDRFLFIEKIDETSVRMITNVSGKPGYK